MSPFPKMVLRDGDFAVLTLTEPWATLVVLGEKQWETRGWPTGYRGRLLIQAAKAMPTYAQQACMSEPFDSVLTSHGVRLPAERPENLMGLRGQRRFPFHFGSIIGAAELTDSKRSEPTRCSLQNIGTRRALQELAFGDFDGGRWAFHLANPVRFDTPIFVRGALGIWCLDRETMEARSVSLELSPRPRDQVLQEASRPVSRPVAHGPLFGDESSDDSNPNTSNGLH